MLLELSCFFDDPTDVGNLISGFRGLGWNPPFNAGDWGSILGSRRSPGEGNGNHSSILPWEIPWTEEPSGLQSMGSYKSQT